MRASPSFADRFDYETEDALIAAYLARQVGTITEAVEQHAVPPVHSMPHPSEAGRRVGPVGAADRKRAT